MSKKDKTMWILLSISVVLSIFLFAKFLFQKSFNKPSINTVNLELAVNKSSDTNTKNEISDKSINDIKNVIQYNSELSNKTISDLTQSFENDRQKYMDIITILGILLTVFTLFSYISRFIEKDEFEELKKKLQDEINIVEYLNKNITTIKDEYKNEKIRLDSLINEICFNNLINDMTINMIGIYLKNDIYYKGGIVDTVEKLSECETNSLSKYFDYINKHNLLNTDSQLIEFEKAYYNYITNIINYQSDIIRTQQDYNSNTNSLFNNLLITTKKYLPEKFYLIINKCISFSTSIISNSFSKKWIINDEYFS